MYKPAILLAAVAISTFSSSSLAQVPTKEAMEKEQAVRNNESTKKLEDKLPAARTVKDDNVSLQSPSLDSVRNAVLAVFLSLMHGGK